MLRISDIGRNFIHVTFCMKYKVSHTSAWTCSKLILTNIVTQEKQCNLIIKEMQTDCWEYSSGLNQKEVEQLLNSNLVYQSYFINSDVMLTRIKAFSNSDVDTEVISHEGFFFFAQMLRCYFCFRSWQQAQ